ncbi:PREDICTED: probable transcriptional regulatory protein Pmob_0807 [Nicrophorus vespilloides]|uniref:Probable transcriptional regulatory protein Pmob_0807 n=1 Tax=Nicrophorus vespilloides TaxID=110193 RepID=A0ABM1N563_NICVS|nr:PREDICTED: probable transcriptional regulatory protein Pmob_0807 [Nicrophorus vespilloides]
MFRNLLKSQTIQLLVKRNAGHSKWANIKHTKGLKDAQRGSLFTKLSRQIKIAITEGGSIDPKLNLKLEQVLEQARRANMPMSTVQNVIKSSQVDKKQCKSHMFEIKGPGGCIILCEIFSDHIHMSKQQIATIVKKYSCKFSDGGGRHLFEEKGIIEAEIPEGSGEILELATDHAIECGAEDVKVGEDTLEFICGSTNLKKVADALENAKYNILSASVEYIPMRHQTLSDTELQTCSALFEKLENLPEVVKLHDNIA